MMKKKWISQLVVLVVVLSMILSIIGCQKSDPTDTNQPTGTPEGTQTPPETDTPPP